MRCFNVTEPELDSIGIMNLVTTGSFSIAAAVLGFCIDFKKDVMFAENLTPQAEAINVAINWADLPFVVALAAIGLWALRKRGTIIEKIKNESSSAEKN